MSITTMQWTNAQTSALYTHGTIAFTAATTATGLYTATTWGGWITGTSTAVWQVWGNQVNARKETKRQKAARERREREEAAAAAERQRLIVAERVEAEKRAEQLLVEHLTEAQRKTLEERNYFDVVINCRTYRIHRGTHGNVRLLDEEGKKEKGLYCVQPAGVPAADAMLAQKLHLEANEQEFLRVANFRAL